MHASTPPFFQPQVAETPEAEFHSTHRTLRESSSNPRNQQSNPLARCVHTKAQARERERTAFAAAIQPDLIMLEAETPRAAMAISAR
jgi:hypothetical protein